MGESALSTAAQLLLTTRKQIGSWSWFKKSLAIVFGFGFLTSSFLFLTPSGLTAREWMAQTVITTQHRDWAWMFVGKEKRDRMVAQLQLNSERQGAEPVDLSLLKLNKRRRSADELIKVEDISGSVWKGKKMYVYDPTCIRVVVPAKPGEGERISSMVQRTGALAGVNGGGFVDPDGLGNGFAPIGFIMSGGKLLYTDQDGSIPQHVVGFTKEGALIVGKYTIDQLTELGVTEAVMFYPRVIANGKPLITSGDGGWGRGPRTAIGQKEDGTVVFYVIDGRQTHSVGATLKEIQDMMLEEGVVNAGFLDGGASSELVTKEGGLLTKPSSRYGERRLPSALLVFADPADYVANNPWEGITKIDPGGAYDHPDFLREQEELRKKGLLKPSPAPTPAKTPEPSQSPSPKPKETNDPLPSSSKAPGSSVPPSATPAAPKGSAAPGGRTPQTSATPTSKPGTGAGKSSSSPSGSGPSSLPSTSKPSATTAPPANGNGDVDVGAGVSELAPASGNTSLPAGQTASEAAATAMPSP